MKKISELNNYYFIVKSIELATDFTTDLGIRGFTFGLGSHPENLYLEEGDIVEVITKEKIIYTPETKNLLENDSVEIQLSDYTW